MNTLLIGLVLVEYSDNDILHITANFGQSFDIFTFDFLLKPPQSATGLFLCFGSDNFSALSNSTSVLLEI